MMQKSKLENYNSKRGALAYRGDYQNKLHRKVSDGLERKIFARLFELLPPCATALDLPCGAGRLFDLIQAKVPRVIEADWSFTMVALDREDHLARAAGYLRCSALDIPLPDRSVDLAVSVRLSHHLETEADRRRHLEELFRVAAKAVVVTWFSHWSLKNVLRRVREPFDKKKPKNTLRTSVARAVGAACGFRLADALPLSRLGSGHVFGLFLRG
jgi:ubiquinone/menaquinone biosynthesis C-methylase UbiE